jgi:hypothetical protein
MTIRQIDRLNTKPFACELCERQTDHTILMSVKIPTSVGVVFRLRWLCVACARNHGIGKAVQHDYKQQ